MYKFLIEHINCILHMRMNILKYYFKIFSFLGTLLYAKTPSKRYGLVYISPNLVVEPK